MKIFTYWFYTVSSKYFLIYCHFHGYVTWINMGLTGTTADAFAVVPVINFRAHLMCVVSQNSLETSRECKKILVYVLRFQLYCRRFKNFLWAVYLIYAFKIRNFESRSAKIISKKLHPFVYLNPKIYFLFFYYINFV